MAGFTGKMVFPPLPIDVYKQWKAVKEVYGVDTFTMFVLSALAVIKLAQMDTGTLNELVVQAAGYPNPWTKTKNAETPNG